MKSFLAFLTEMKPNYKAKRPKLGPEWRPDWLTAKGNIRTGVGMERQIKKVKDRKWGKGRDESEPNYDEAMGKANQ